MIYTKSGVPMDAMFWMGVREQIAAARHRQATKGRRVYLQTPIGDRAYRVAHDKTGAPYKIFRDVTEYMR